MIIRTALNLLIFLITNKRNMKLIIINIVVKIRKFIHIPFNSNPPLTDNFLCNCLQFYYCTHYCTIAEETVLK